MIDVMMWRMAEDIAKIGMRIAGLRNDLGLTQADLARMVNETIFKPNVSQSQIANIETGKGKHLPSTRLLGGMAQALRTSTDYILGLTNDQSAYADEQDQVVVSVDDPDRRAKIQAVAELLRKMPDADISLVGQLIERIQSGKVDSNRASNGGSKRATKEEYETLDQLWMSVFMLAGADKAQTLLDSGVPASPQFRRMISLAITKNNELSNKVP